MEIMEENSIDALRQLALKIKKEIEKDISQDEIGRASCRERV